MVAQLGRQERSGLHPLQPLSWAAPSPLTRRDEQPSKVFLRRFSLACVPSQPATEHRTLDAGEESCQALKNLIMSRHFCKFQLEISLPRGCRPGHNAEAGTCNVPVHQSLSRAAEV